MRIAFAGTPTFAATQLEALLQTPHEIKVVYTQPDKPAGRGHHLQASPVKQLALAHHLFVEQPAHLNTPKVLKTFAHYQIDLMIVAAYGLLLPETFLAIPRFGCINVHASLLPRWRGASPIQQAILNGDKETGITLMQMAKGLDSGDILLKAACSIEENDTSLSLEKKLAQLGANLLKENLSALPQLTRVPQCIEDVTYAPKITKDQAKVDWSKSAMQLAREIRAYHPWPVAYSFLQQTRIRIWQAFAEATSACSSSLPGTIVAHTPTALVVATGCGNLHLTHLQFPGKSCLPFTVLCQAHADSFAIGQCFNEEQ